MGGKERRLFGECALGWRYSMSAPRTAAVEQRTSSFSVGCVLRNASQQPTPLPEVDVIRTRSPWRGPATPPPKRTQPSAIDHVAGGARATGRAAPPQPIPAAVRGDKVPSNSRRC